MATVTLKDIAKAAEVGMTTVSYILSGQAKERRVAQATSLKVKQVAKSLGYRTNALARVVATGKSKVIGFLTRPGSSEHLNAIISGMQKRMNESGYLMKFLYVSNDSSVADYEKLVDTCVEQRICALICHSRSKFFVRYLQENLPLHGIPLGIVSNSYLPVGSLHVGSDDAHGVKLAMEYLFSMGHRKIATFNQNISFPYAAVRQKAFKDYMEKQNIEIPDCYIHASDDYDEMRQKLKDLIKSKNPPSAIACGSDFIALLLMGTAWSEGLRVPEDISFIGFGNFGFGRFTTPPLTTIYEPFTEMGYAVVENMIMLIENRGKSEMRQIIDSRLIIRDSVISIK